MGAKQSSNNNNSREQAATGGSSIASTSGSSGLALLNLRHRNGASGSSNSSDSRQRARSLSNVINGHSGQAISISPHHGAEDLSVSPEPDADLEIPISRIYAAAHSLPVQLVAFHGLKCPVCSKYVPPDDVECHLVMCLTKPRIIYNEDVLIEDKGECVICLEELSQGDTIARLPCLCIYHKSCIDAWFQVNRSCPEHPLD